MKSLIFVVALLGFQSFASADSQTLSMKEVLDQATQGPEPKASKALAEKAGNEASASWRGTYLPKLTAGLIYSHLLETQEIILPSAGGFSIPASPVQPNFFLGAVQLSQTLFDPSSMLFNNPAAQENAEAEQLKASRATKETQGKAIDNYLQILELRSQRDALEMYVTNLKGRQTEIARLYELGSVSEGDVLKVKLGIDDANQGIREIKQKESYLEQVLAAVLGQEKAVSPDELPQDLPNPVFAAESNVSNRREDIQSLDKQLDSLEKSKNGSKAQYLPKVAAVFQHFDTNANILSRSDFNVVGLQLSWSIFDGGVALSNARASASEREALEQRRSLTVASVQATLNDAVASLAIRKQEYDERRSDVIEAKKVTDIEFKRLKTGKTTVNNLIDAEDTLKDRTEKASLSRVNWYEAWFNMQLASGSPLRAP